MIQINYPHTFNFRYGLGLLSSSKMPMLPIILKSAGGSYPSLALVDTGATYSLFDGQIAGLLGLNLMSGRQQVLDTLGGKVTAYAHSIEMDIDLELKSQVIPLGSMEVLFSQQPVTRFILGRSDFLSCIELGFCEKTEQLHVNKI